MGNKSDARALRKALGQERFEAAKAALLAKVDADRQARHIIMDSVDAAPRLAPHLVRSGAATVEKAPRSNKDGSRFADRVTWCITKADRQNHWSWGEPRQWTKKEWEEIIHPPFQQFAQLSWQEVDRSPRTPAIKCTMAMKWATLSLKLKNAGAHSTWKNTTPYSDSGLVGKGAEHGVS